MIYIKRIFIFLSSLKVAISLLFIIALSSAIGTAIPQEDERINYLNNYTDTPWLGIINGEAILKLQLDHVYSSYWFLTLLAWLTIALIVCSWRRQLPSLRSAIKWLHYDKPEQISKLAISKILKSTNPSESINKLEVLLKKKGWQTEKKENSLAARKGIVGRFGPPIVHFGLILLIFGATLGSIKGQKFENFLVPGRSIDLISPNQKNKLSFFLESFKIERSPEGQPEQFKSLLKIIDSAKENPIYKEISVNHPLRYNGLTIYQADWSLAAITIQIGNSPKLQLPLTSIPELGEQVWGLILPNIEDNNEQILATISSEEGPLKVFNQEGEVLGFIRPKGKSITVREKELNLYAVLASSGILIKRDPGVPIVYIGFAITLLGGIMSIISTKFLWAISKEDGNSIYIGGKCNRDLTGFSKEFPKLIKPVLE
tara:strand:+ start:78 stop:1364 length:1287 start_codon:yes stop_codon:yes gene_type:complete